ncbi:MULTISPECIES: aldehyde dehydrogenase family protein [Delftia]|uniref:aldehyde dehydrogenase family protein n=1 Tax=Delftia TaxID=80865 RepID=UPI00077391CE|nr:MULTISPECIES: aldehyde dehydrogenase family protein [Delftia]
MREAIDFLRFYAAQPRSGFDPAAHRPPGPVLCIKQMPLTATQVAQLLRQGGIPAAAIQLLRGEGATVGAHMLTDARVQAAMLTGSTEVARTLQRTWAQRLGERSKAL